MIYIIFNQLTNTNTHNTIFLNLTLINSYRKSFKQSAHVKKGAFRHLN